MATPMNGGTPTTEAQPAQPQPPRVLDNPPTASLPQALAQSGVTNGFCGIAVAGGHIYWTTGGFVGRANLDGTGVSRRFIRTASGPCAVAVYQGHIYWGHSTGDSAHPSTTIGRANLDGSAVNDRFITGIHDTCGGLAIG